METVMAAQLSGDETVEKPGWCTISFERVSGLQSGESRLRVIMPEHDARRLAENLARQLSLIPSASG